METNKRLRLFLYLALFVIFLLGVALAIIAALYGSTSNELNELWTNKIITNFAIPYGHKSIACTLRVAPTSNVSLIFTQGAQGDIRTPRVINFADGFAELKNILCFQSENNLKARVKMYKSVCKQHPCTVIGGRSMGARVATMVAKEIDDVQALILPSYPLVGRKNNIVRDKLLLDIDERIDVLLIIGDKDPMTKLSKLRPILKRMKAKTWLAVVRNATHKMDVTPPKATDLVGKMVGRVAAKWIDERDKALTNCEISWDEDANDVFVGPWTKGDL